MTSDTRKPAGWLPLAHPIRSAPPGQIIYGNAATRVSQPISEMEQTLDEDFSGYVREMEQSSVATVQIPVDLARGITRPSSYYGFFTNGQHLPIPINGQHHTYLAQNVRHVPDNEMERRATDKAFLRVIKELKIPKPDLAELTVSSDDPNGKPKTVEFAYFGSKASAEQFRQAVIKPEFYRLFKHYVLEDYAAMQELLGQNVDLSWFERLAGNIIYSTTDKDGKPYCYFIARDTRAPNHYDPEQVKYQHHPISPTDQVIIEACLAANIQAPDIQAQYTTDNQFIGVAYLFTSEDQARRFQQFISEPKQVADAVRMLDAQVLGILKSKAQDRPPTPQGDAPSRGEDWQDRVAQGNGNVIAHTTSKAIH